MKAPNYYIGLDIGTDSIGYAVVDEDYRLIKSHGEPMLGAHLFEAANLCNERRGYRTARRRTRRTKQRVLLVQELFASAIEKVDPTFYLRLRESALLAEDKSQNNSENGILGSEITDSDYHAQYPTIHHLICDLIESNKIFDVRLVYLAVSYLVSSRGHFLTEIGDDIDALRSIKGSYNKLMQYFDENGIERPWECDADTFAEVMRKKSGVREKEKAFIELLFGGIKPNKSNDEGSIDVGKTLTLLSGGAVKPKDLFHNEDYSEVQSIKLDIDEDVAAALASVLGDDFEYVQCLKAIYDWHLLCDRLCDDSPLISKRKVEIYEQHKTDLKKLKSFVKKYLPKQYDEIFRIADKSIHNYVSYSYNLKSVHNIKTKDLPKKASKVLFCDYLRKKLEIVSPSDEDMTFYDDMMVRLKLYCFLPKQVEGDNRVIPMQLYRYELNEILKKAESYLPFLCVKDESGLSISDKLVSIFNFRIPYYVGPLNSNSSHAWIVRKAEGKIYPWNFDDMVDHDRSESCFIKRMTNKCTYLAGEDVLPKTSLLYEKFTVLNEINNLRMDGNPISVKCKQAIYNELFLSGKKISVKAIAQFIISNGFAESQKGVAADSRISGIDISIKSTLKSHHAFSKLINSGKLTEDQVETIIERMTYSDDRVRREHYLMSKFPSLPTEDRRYIASLSFKDFGRLSRKLLCEIVGTDKSSGLSGSLIDMMWETNMNFMELMSSNYTFKEQIEEFAHEYYSEYPLNLNDRLDEMYISNSVKRPIIRTLAIVDEIVKAAGSTPKKIFVEMARGGNPEDKGKRTKSRREQIHELISNFPKDEVSELINQLENTDDRDLQSEMLFLYFMQLGRSMYSNTRISLGDLKSERCNIDHIYPQCKVKDDSFSNRVLVLSEENSNKGDTYPLSPEIQRAQESFWNKLHKNKMISDEKLYRLTRKTSFSDEELNGFINRQLVETRQSTKAVTVLLKNYYPDTEVVFVKAKLVSEFRQQFNLAKPRSLNDLHHAKDAYLNIVVGNVYYTLFNAKWFNASQKNYSLKTSTIFGESPKGKFNNVENAWQGKQSLELVLKTMEKNCIHLTRYAFCRKGGLFDQNPLKAQEGLIPKKKGQDTAKYGGYQRPTAAFFVLVSYVIAKKKEEKKGALILAVDLLVADKYLTDRTFAKEYTLETAQAILGKDKITAIDFPLGDRILKVNTMFSFDGFRYCLAGKSSGGKYILFAQMMSLFTDKKKEAYIKHLEAFAKKKEKDKNLQVDTAFDKISIDENLNLYRFYCDKLASKPFSELAGPYTDCVLNGEEKFLTLSPTEQVDALLSIGKIFKSGRGGPCDLTIMGGLKFGGNIQFSSKLESCSEYSDIRIIDSSASGIWEKQTDNLLDLLS